MLEAIQNTLGFIFDVRENIDLVYVKAAVWFVAYVMIFRSVTRILPSNRGGAAIISLIVSLIGVRYMPEGWIEWMGAYAIYLLVFIVILLPYLGGNLLGTIFRLGRGGKAFIIIGFYVGLAYAMTKLKGLPIEREALGILGVALEWMMDNRVVVFIAIAIILLIYLFSGRGEGPPVPRGPGVFGGLGRGARGLGGMAWGRTKRGGRFLWEKAKRKMKVRMRAQRIAKIRAEREAQKPKGLTRY